MNKRYPSALALPALAAALAPAALAQSADYDTLPELHGLVPQPGGASAALADLDNDGFLDVIGLRNAGPNGGTGSNWSFYYQPGLGGEQFGAVVSDPFGLSTWSDQEGSTVFSPTLTLGDVDGDGDLDLFTSGPAIVETNSTLPAKTASLYYWQNTGTDAAPVFAAPVENPFGISAAFTTSSGEAAHPALHDLDGDGDLDLVSVAPNAATVYLNSGSNPPVFVVVDGNYGLTSSPATMRGITLFDVDGDGDADLVVTESGGRIACHLDASEEGEPPAFAAETDCLVDRRFHSLVPHPHTISFGNLDADPEAEALHFFAGQTFVMQPQAGGHYAPDAYDPLALGIVASAMPVVPRARDFDRDGDVDVLVVDRGSNQPVRYLENTGPRMAPVALEPFGLTGAAFGFSGIDFADFNGDGRFDAVAASEYYAGNLAVFYDLNASGAPAFGPATAPPTDLPGPGRYHPAAGDLDNDGDADLVLGSAAGGLIVMRNTPDFDGMPVFTTAPADGLVTVGPETSPSLYDFDGDGDADLYVGQAGGAVLLFRNDTPVGGAFVFTQISTPDNVTATGSVTVEPTDLDGDGDADLILADHIPSLRGDAMNPSPTLRLLVSGTTTLPVELTAFTATLDGARAVLDWTTASETNNAGFDVEHGVSGGAFRSLGFVPGGGTSVEARSYRFTAPDLAPGTHVFRLKQVDFDGAFVYSPAVELTVRADGLALTILGNPAREAIRGTLALPHGDARLTLFDVLGRKVLVQEGVSGAFSLDATGLSSGLYVLRVEAGLQTITRQVVVTR